MAIIGAGPYGLSAASHLRAARIETRIFGEAMEFWRCQMPAGMFLRSSWEASHISHPNKAFTLDEYQEKHGLKLPVPVPLDNFIEYGQWFQSQVAPDLERRRVKRMEKGQRGFRLLMEDGKTVETERVVVAAGIAPFAHRPAPFNTLPPELASHSSDHRDLGRFRGMRVMVVGGGQSAVESAALLHENGADVELAIRAGAVRWLTRSGSLHKLPSVVRRALYAPTDVGPPGLSWVVAKPNLFRRLPHSTQAKVAYRSIRPAASGWLFTRMADVPITAGRQATSASPQGDKLLVKFDDGSERLVDHVLMATGYQVDISRYGFLAPELVSAVRKTNGYPLLSRGLESSVPGLHFLGAPAAESFGPVVRFVSGTTFAAGALARYVKGKGSSSTNGKGKP